MCSKQNYFKCNGEFFKHTNGLPMGSLISPLVAELFMSNFEDIIFSKTSNDNLVKPTHFWARYVYDIFCIWTGTDRQFTQFHKHLSNINKNIKFTKEIEKNFWINILDLKKSHFINIFEFDISRKPSTIYRIKHSNSYNHDYL